MWCSVNHISVQSRFSMSESLSNWFLVLVVIHVQTNCYLICARFNEQHKDTDRYNVALVITTAIDCLPCFFPEAQSPYKSTIFNHGIVPCQNKTQHKQNKIR